MSGGVRVKVPQLEEPVLPCLFSILSSDGPLLPLIALLGKAKNLIIVNLLFLLLLVIALRLL